MQRNKAFASVYNKTGLSELADFLGNRGWTLYSTGGTLRHLKQQNSESVVSIEDLTGSKEILGGRVKTLHPKVHGSILATDKHDDPKEREDLIDIGLVVVNLYPFERVFDSNFLEDPMELMDIGGHSLIRSAIKNYENLTVLTHPQDYLCFMKNYDNIVNDVKLRKQYAQKAASYIARYDMLVNQYFNGADYRVRAYRKQFDLKYGCNPHQTQAALYTIDTGIDSNVQKPFEVLNGRPGYINLLDALYGYRLVSDLKLYTGLPAAASYKHNSPAGAAVGVPLDENLMQVYDTKAQDPLAVAFARARNADPKSSFGDFIALSDHVNIEVARLIKREVSDGIIAPSYDPDALKILQSKKRGSYVILQANDSLHGPICEIRELFGVALSQTVDNSDPTEFGEAQTKAKELTSDQKRDAIIANLTLKYCQSNSVCFALDGQIIGVGAGQQSRIDCVKLAAEKARIWFLRQHPKVMGLKNLFQRDIGRQARINAQIRYIEGDFTNIEFREWLLLFKARVEPFVTGEKNQWIDDITLSNPNTVLASDAFFPFRDSIDCASKIGTKVVVQPGGSSRDSTVIEACNQYKMIMFCTGIRLFHH